MWKQKNFTLKNFEELLNTTRRACKLTDQNDPNYKSFLKQGENQNMIFCVIT